MELTPEIAKALEGLGTTVAKQLWPQMLFLLCMSVIALWGGHWWASSLDRISYTASFWIWFLACIVIMWYGVRAFTVELNIQAAQALSKLSKKTR